MPEPLMAQGDIKSGWEDSSLVGDYPLTTQTPVVEWSSTRGTSLDSDGFNDLLGQALIDLATVCQFDLPCRELGISQ